MLFNSKQSSKFILKMSIKPYNLRNIFWSIISKSNQNLFSEMQQNKQVVNNFFFWKKNVIFLCRGPTKSPINIHKFSLELSHLFGTSSLDSCLIQNQISIENKRVQIDWNFNPKDFRWIFKIDFQRDIWREMFPFKKRKIICKQQTQGSNTSKPKGNKITK